MMQAEFTFAILRNFAVLTAMLLVIKNLAWCGELLYLHLKAQDVRILSHKQHVTDEWVIRAGSVLIALSALFALIVATLEHVVRWLQPTPATVPAAFMSLVCLQTLMVWRLFYFAQRKEYMVASLGCLFALSLVIEMAR